VAQRAVGADIASMGKLNDVRTWLLISAGWGVAASIGLLVTSMQLREPLYAYYSGAAGVYFAGLLCLAPRLSTSRMRRRWLMLVSVVTCGLCAFGLTVGLVVYGASAAIFVALTLICIAHDTREPSRRPVQRSA
jgi:hypothetical protein